MGERHRSRSRSMFNRQLGGLRPLLNCRWAMFLLSRPSRERVASIAAARLSPAISVPYATLLCPFCVRSASLAAILAQRCRSVTYTNRQVTPQMVVGAI